MNMERSSRGFVVDTTVVGPRTVLYQYECHNGCYPYGSVPLATGLMSWLMLFDQ